MLPLSRRSRSHRRLPIAIAAALAASGFSAVAFSAPARAADPCAAPTNPIVCENSLPGTPPTEWDIDGAGDDSIQGYATDFSVNAGSTVSFKVKASAAYTVRVYRLGYYGGDGARFVTNLTPTARTQPDCLTEAATGLIDCGNWQVSASWAVPSTAVSGVYLALLHRTDTGGESHVPFVVRSDAGTSDVVFQTSDTTWQAYNSYGGNSLYIGQPAGRAYKVSYNRPFNTRGSASGRDYLFGTEYPMIRFLEANGYDVSYISGIDTDRAGALLKNHKTYLSVGHDEYWSGTQRANVEAARDAGVNLGFFSGNEVYWKIRWENSIDGSGTPRRTMVCYKETKDDAKTDPSTEWTGTWRDPRFSPPSNGGRPENGLTGTLYMSNFTDLPLQVPAAQGKNRFWRGTTVASLGAGQTASLVEHGVGYESDEDLDNGSRPPGLIKLSTTTGDVPDYLQDFGLVTAPGTTTHNMTMYRAPSGALVFGAGTIQYTLALDETHDGEATATNQPMRQATVNLLADMGVQPRSLQSGLSAATRSTDTTPPTSTITAPAAGATIANGSQVTVTGAASDTGGVVGGVEVSTDGGTSWHPATGTTSWSYTYSATGAGSTSLRSRATDDSGNIQTTPATRTVNVTCPCSIFGGTVPRVPAVADGSDVELGLRFQAAEDGLVGGVRFYKGSGNGGTHVGSLWSASGTRLATATFTGETATGWQTATFTSPVYISASTTYTVSYRAPSGHFAGDPLYFSARGTSSPPLTAPRSTVTARNGVYGDPGRFPTSSYRDANYWVDVVFSASSVTAPAVVASSPAAGSDRASRTAPITATFAVPVTPGTPVITVTPQGGGPVAGTTALDGSRRVLSFTPTVPLAGTTLYTVTVTGAQSSSGVPMTAPGTWTFTTVADCPCSLFHDSDTPPLADSGDSDSVELGVKFVPSADGLVTGVRFYKAATNTGTHTGTLWSPTGTPLATGTFTGETASGWQSMGFATPVHVSAGTTYTVSYYAPRGHYAYSGNYFSGELVNGSLSSPGGENGVYRYGGGYPASTYNDANYWVDVVYLDGGIPDTTGPVITAVSAAPRATSVTVTWTTDKPASSSVAYGTSAGALTGTATSSGNSTTHSVRLTGLLPGTTYYYRVTSVDVWNLGTTSPEPPAAPLTVTTTTCPCSLFSTADTPAVSDSGDTDEVELGVRFVPSVNGTVTGVRFYKDAANVGTHTGTLWSATGTPLATGTFTGETASGWQTLTFDTPVPVTAGTAYVASYVAPSGHYSLTGQYFADDVSSDPLTAPAQDNGVFRYGGGFPANTFNSTNYWVDVIFGLG